MQFLNSHQQTAVEILRKVLTCNQKDKVPLNSFQQLKQKHKASIKASPVIAEPPQNTQAPTPEPHPNYVSDSEDEEEDEDDEATVKRSNCNRSPRTAADDGWDFNSIPEPHSGIRRSKRILQQIRDNQNEGFHRIAALATNETATIPNLAISEGKLTRG